MPESINKQLLGTPNPGDLALVRLRSRSLTKVANWIMKVEPNSSGFTTLAPPSEESDTTATWRMRYIGASTVAGQTTYTYAIQHVDSSKFLVVYWNELLIRWMVAATGDTFDESTYWHIRLNNQSGQIELSCGVTNTRLLLGVRVAEEYNAIWMYSSNVSNLECDWDIITI